MSSSYQLGKTGEEMALKHLQREGYKVLNTNWRHGKDEIDIVCEKGDQLVIVEVKTRGTDFFGDPQEFLSKGQQNRIIRAADNYVKEHEIDHEVRFDFIGIVLNREQRIFRHIEDAFCPGP